MLLKSSVFRILQRIAIALLLAISGAQVFAEDNANFLKLIQDSAEQQLVLNAAKQSAVVLQTPCASANFALVDQYAIYEPVKFDASGKITAGAWKQTVSEKGCGHERLLNVLVLIGANTKGLKALPLFPGTTRADPILQRDAMMYAVMAATCPEAENCKTIYIADTKFLDEIGEPLEGAKGKPWDELWTLGICTKKAQVTMHFVPDATGTTIHTTPTETKFLPADSK